MEYEGQEIVGIKTKGEIEKQRYIRYKVDEYSIRRCLEETKNNSWVVGIDYVGDMQELKSVEYKPGYKPVIVIKDVGDIVIKEIPKIKKQLPEWVRLVLRLPQTFKDMRKIHNLGQNYPEIRVCGGELIRLEGCQIGCITDTDLPKEVTDMKKLYTTKGCGCVQLTMNITELDNYEVMYEAEKVVIESLSDLLKM